MPQAVEEALGRAANRLAKKGKLRRKKNASLEEAKKAFIYGTMQKKMGYRKKGGHFVKAA